MIIYNKSYDFSSIDVEQCNNMRELIEYRHNNLITLSKLENKIKVLLEETQELDVEHKVIKFRDEISSLNLLSEIINKRMDEIRRLKL
jgi:hypothetical protein